MEASTPKDFFEKTLPSRFDASRAAGVNVVVQVIITGVQESSWIVIIKDQKLNVEQGIYPSPTLSLKMTNEDFLDLVNHRISAQKAFFTGKVHFKGDIALAMRLRDAGFL